MIPGLTPNPAIRFSVNLQNEIGITKAEFRFLFFIFRFSF